jgi:hypothetical protein
MLSNDEDVVDRATRPEGQEAAGRDAGATVPVLIHVGLHKTGTTWLQDNVFYPNAGKTFVYTEERRLLRGNFIVPDVDDYDDDQVRSDFAPLIDEARSRGLSLVLVDEILAALPWDSRVRGIAARRMAAAFPGAMVLLTIREQDSVILSSYGHYVRGGGSASLEDFLAEPDGDHKRHWTPILNRNHFDYFKTVRHYESVFGEGRVIVSPLEWATADPERFSDLIASRTGIAMPFTDRKRADKVVNPALSHLALTAFRHANRFRTAETRWKGSRRFMDPGTIASYADRLTPAGLQSKAKAKAREQVRAAIGDRYRASNRAMSDWLGIDLGALGYRV